MILNIEEPYDYEMIEMTKTWLLSADDCLRYAIDEKLKERIDNARKQAREKMQRTVSMIARKLDLALNDELTPAIESNREKNKLLENKHRECSVKTLIAHSTNFDMFGFRAAADRDKGTEKISDKPKGDEKLGTDSAKVTASENQTDSEDGADDKVVLKSEQQQMCPVRLALKNKLRKYRHSGETNNVGGSDTNPISLEIQKVCDRKGKSQSISAMILEMDEKGQLAKLDWHRQNNYNQFDLYLKNLDRDLRVEIDRTFSQCFCETFGKPDKSTYMICADINKKCGPSNDFDLSSNSSSTPSGAGSASVRSSSSDGNITRSSSFESITDLVKITSDTVIDPALFDDFLKTVKEKCQIMVLRDIENRRFFVLDEDKRKEFEKDFHETMTEISKSGEHESESTSIGLALDRWWLGNGQVLKCLRLIATDMNKKWLEWRGNNWKRWTSYTDQIVTDAAAKVALRNNETGADFEKLVLRWENVANKSQWWGDFFCAFKVASTFSIIWMKLLWFRDTLSESLREEIRKYVSEIRKKDSEGARVGLPKIVARRGEDPVENLEALLRDKLWTRCKKHLGEMLAFILVAVILILCGGGFVTYKGFKLWKMREGNDSESSRQAGLDNKGWVSSVVTEMSKVD